MMKIYVASSWRNTYQPEVVIALREDGHDVYDFKNPAEGNNGFSWREVDPGWINWPKDIDRYFTGLNHPTAERGFDFDMNALKDADACVYVTPCGVSASLEAGYAQGSGKLVIGYMPEIREPELMVKMFGLITSDLSIVREALKSYALAKAEGR